MNPLSMLLWLAAAILALSAAALVADEDDREHEGSHGRQAAYLADAGYALYQAECGSCHLAYPPFLLPAASWRTMMTQLDRHFGDHAALETAPATEITAFLERQSADRGDGAHHRGTWRSTRKLPPPLRLTETAYFIGQHHEVPARLAADPAVGGFGRCQACHPGAAEGQFDEHAVRLPGRGRWED